MLVALVAIIAIALLLEIANGFHDAALLAPPGNLAQQAAPLT